jgi:hypothetical protein
MPVQHHPAQQQAQEVARANLLGLLLHLLRVQVLLPVMSLVVQRRAAAVRRFRREVPDRLLHEATVSAAKRVKRAVCRLVLLQALLLLRQMLLPKCRR